jgi:SAM-dependent methyltransferase
VTEEVLPDRREHDPVRWFDEHYNDAADEILEFLSADGIALEDKMVCDIGAGDGIIDLGLAIKGKPQALMGYDVRLTDYGGLHRAAQAAGVVGDEMPQNLTFIQSDTESIPAQTGVFDVAVTWSVFEHVDNPVALLAEVRRILKPTGVLFLQLWPFWLSQHGGHLWPHIDDPFPHLMRKDEAILDEVDGKRATDPTRTADDEYRSLNHLTLDGLQRALLAAGLLPTKLKLICDTVHIPVSLGHIPLSDLGVGGVELLAVPR